MLKSQTTFINIFIAFQGWGDDWWREASQSHKVKKVSCLEARGRRCKRRSSKVNIIRFQKSIFKQKRRWKMKIVWCWHQWCWSQWSWRRWFDFNGVDVNDVDVNGVNINGVDINNVDLTGVDLNVLSVLGVGILLELWSLVCLITSISYLLQRWAKFARADAGIPGRQFGGLVTSREKCICCFMEVSHEWLTLSHTPLMHIPHSSMQPFHGQVPQGHKRTLAAKKGMGAFSWSEKRLGSSGWRFLQETTTSCRPVCLVTTIV